MAIVSKHISSTHLIRYVIVKVPRVIVGAQIRLVWRSLQMQSIPHYPSKPWMSFQLLNAIGQRITRHVSQSLFRIAQQTLHESSCKLRRRSREFEVSLPLHADMSY